MILRKGFFVVSVAVVLLVLTLGAGSASADTMGFDLAYTNLSDVIGPYVHVNISASGGGATITFTALANGGLTYYLIGSAMALNVNGAYTVTGTSGFYGFSGSGSCKGSGFIVGAGCVDTSANQGGFDGFGKFNLTISNQNANTGLTSLSVTLSGGSWGSNASNVLTGNNNGDVAASHIAPGPTGDPSSANRRCTGYAGGTTNTPSAGSEPCGAVSTPEPDSLLLLGCGLLGLSLVVGRRLTL